MSSTRFWILPAVLLVSAAAFADDAPAPVPPKNWKNETEASVVSANGNTKSTTSSGKNTFTFTKGKTGSETIAGGLGSRSDGSVTAEKYFASQKVTYKVSERNYAFVRFAWDKDRFAGIRDRFDESLGLGRELIKRDNDALLLELGSGWIQEDRLGSENEKFAAGRAYAKYEHKFSATSSFLQDAEYQHNYENPEDIRAKTETAIIAALSAHFSLKTSYRWQYVGSPPDGFGRNDTLLSVALLAVY